MTHHHFPQFSTGLAAVCALTILSTSAFGQTVTPSAGLTPEDWVGLRAALDAEVHKVESAGTGFQAFSPGQRWLTEFDGAGFLVLPTDAAWSWGLELQSYGRGDQRTVTKATDNVSAEGGRVTYDWDGNLEEWFVNDKRGVEHGFTLQSRPDDGSEQAGVLTFELAVRGELSAELQASGTGIIFSDAQGLATLSYSGLHVFDSKGTSQPAFFSVGENTVQIVVDDSQATYPLTVDPVSQRAYLKAFNTDPLDGFGAAVAISGDRVVIGAPFESSAVTGVNVGGGDNNAPEAGAAYVFQRTGIHWRLIAYLKASNTGANDHFGASVAIDGDRIVVGAPGESGNRAGVNPTVDNDLAPRSGAIYVFDYANSAWTESHMVKASNPNAGDGFGTAVAVFGQKLAAGAPGEDGSSSGVNGNQSSNGALESGAVYAFGALGVSLSQTSYIKASNNGAGDRFGSSVALSEIHLVVGAPNEDSDAVGWGGNQTNNASALSGAVYMFDVFGSGWVPAGYIKASNTGAGDHFGTAVSLSDDIVVVGAPGEDSDAVGVNGIGTNDLTPGAGAAYVYRRSVGTWIGEAFLKASDVNPVAAFGSSVSVSGNRIVVGAPLESRGSGTAFDNHQTGAAYLFAFAGGSWTQGPYLKALAPDRDDQFAGAVSLSSDRAVMGAMNEDSNATGVLGDDTDNSSTDSGAGYIFDLANPYEHYCGPAVPNSTGFSSSLLGAGSVFVGDNRFYLGAFQIPNGVFAYFISSLGRDYLPLANGSQGTLCVGGGMPIGRHRNTIQRAPNFGFIISQIDLTAMPSSNGPITVGSGETWNFQCWYRDMNPTNTTNYTDGLSVLFE